MVIANGFISPNKDAALEEVKKLCNGSEVRVAVMPITTNSYFVSDIGDMFGCQQMKDFVIVKRMTVYSNKNKGCYVRYAIGGGDQKNGYVHCIVYCTFVLGYWDGDVALEGKDGNIHNYKLDNIKVKDNSQQAAMHMVKYQECYRKYFNDVCTHILWIRDMEIEEAQDIASDVFIRLCERPYQSATDFVGLWKYMCKFYVINEYINKQKCIRLTTIEKEIAYRRVDKYVEVDNPLLRIKDENQREIVKCYFNGYTPTEISQKFGKPVSTVSSCVTRNIKHLRKIYAKDIAI